MLMPPKGGRDPNRLSWPPLRSDVLALVFLIAFGYCLVENRGVEVTIAVLFAAVFSGLSPRMKGRWGWQSSHGSSLGGEFDDPFEDLTQAELGEPLQLGPAPGSPPKTESGED